MKESALGENLFYDRKSSFCRCGEMVDTGDLKSPDLLSGHAGSIPAGGTIRLRPAALSSRDYAAIITSKSINK